MPGSTLWRDVATGAGHGAGCRRETEAQATSLRGTPVDLVGMTMIPVKVPNGSFRPNGRLELDVSGVALDDFTIADYRQTIEGQRITIRKEPLGAGLLDPTGRSQYLKPELLIQSDHPDILAAARTALGAATNTVDAAKNLMNWIHEHIDQRSVLWFRAHWTS